MYRVLIMRLEWVGSIVGDDLNRWEFSLDTVSMDGVPCVIRLEFTEFCIGHRTRLVTAGWVAFTLGEG